MIRIDTLLCDTCGYRANRQVATVAKPPSDKATPEPLEEVHTPDTTTIEELAAFLQIDPAQTAKAVFFMADIGTSGGVVAERFVFAVVRGDMELNETKLANVVKAITRIVRRKQQCFIKRNTHQFSDRVAVLLSI